MSDNSDNLIPEAVQHRVAFSHVGAIIKGGIHFGSVWLRDTEGLSEENMQILQAISRALTQVKGPWILGGDWNIPPEVLMESGWVDSIEGVIVAPKVNTCNNSVYDYFIISVKLRHAVRGVQVVNDHQFSPHHPTRMYIDGDARRKLARRIRKPTKIPGILPHGPAGPDAAFPADDMINEDTPAAVKAWYSGARQELRFFGAFDGVKCNTLEEAQFVWQPAIGATASPYTGSTFGSTSWRFLERVARDNGHLSAKNSVAGNTAMQANVHAAMIRARKCKDSAAENGLLLEWVHKQARASMLRNLAILKQLSCIAGGRGQGARSCHEKD